MTSYVMPVRQLSQSLLKRVRSASSSSPSLSCSSSVSSADKENSNCCTNNNAAMMKVTKRALHSSPRSAAQQQQQMATTAIMTASQRPSLSPFTSIVSKRARVQPASASWPVVKSCDGVRNAITFLQTSRQHAMMLMLQNHWERAVGVLEKIEKATESVCTQRRKVVIQQANTHVGGGLAAQIDDLGLSDDEATTSVKPARRSVRFCEQVRVAVADDIDRSSDDVPVPVREEMLVLRASRSIPQENYSEFW